MGPIIGFINALTVSFENRAIRKLKDKSSVLVNTYRFAAWAIIAIVVAALFGFWEIPTSVVWFAVTFTIISELLVNMFYVKAFQNGDQSLVGPLFGLSIIFLVPLEMIFLNEELTTYGILGLIVVVTGVMTLGWGNLDKLKSFTWNKGVVYMLLATLFAALAIFFARLGIKNLNPIMIAVLVSTTLLIIHLPIVIANRKKRI